MRICQFIGLVLALIFIGCSEDKPTTDKAAQPPPPPPPKPTINVSFNEVGQITISFPHHVKTGTSAGYYTHYAEIDLHNVEDLRLYKKQVDFLVKQLEDAEQRMEIHELEAK